MCGLVGIVNVANAAGFVVPGLHAIQQRGREAAGIASSDGQHLYCEGGPGRVRDQFPNPVDRKEPPRVLRLPGPLAVGHVRYSTVEKGAIAVFQPLGGYYCGRPFYVGHNGNLTNKEELYKLIPPERLRTNLDTECIVRLLEEETSGDIEADLTRVLMKLEGSYELLILFMDEIIAVRSPTGTHPLSVGRREDGGYVIASETAAFFRLDAAYEGNVEPGTFIRFPLTGTPKRVPYAKARLKLCLFEPVYFMGVTSDANESESVMQFRIRAGRQAAYDCPPPKNADMVLGVPDSAVAYAVGYSIGCKEQGFDVPHVQAVIRHHDGSRTFILPGQDEREVEVRQKFQWVPRLFTGKVCVIIDDSKVRGTTSKYFNERTRAAGAAEIHEVVIFPPYKHPCTYGIDNAAGYDELLAAYLANEEIRKYVKADSLQYFGLESLIKLTGVPAAHWCTACLTGAYWHKKAA